MPADNGPAAVEPLAIPRIKPPRPRPRPLPRPRFACAWILASSALRSACCLATSSARRWRSSSPRRTALGLNLAALVVPREEEGAGVELDPAAEGAGVTVSDRVSTLLLSATAAGCEAPPAPGVLLSGAVSTAGVESSAGVARAVPPRPRSARALPVLGGISEDLRL